MSMEIRQTRDDKRRAKVLVLLSVSMSLISACANHRFIDSPELVAHTNEFGRVLRTDLVLATYSGDGRRGRPFIVDLADLSESDRPVELSPGGRPDAVIHLPSYIVDESRIARNDGWEIRTTVLLNDGREITIASLKDYMLSPGDRVRVGFGNPSGRTEGQQVVLRLPDDNFVP